MNNKIKLYKYILINWDKWASLEIPEEEIQSLQLVTVTKEELYELLENGNFNDLFYKKLKEKNGNN